MTRLWGLGVPFLFSTLAFASGIADLNGVWKIESEYLGRPIYFFEVKDGQSHLAYPPDEAFVGQVPHASNAFRAGTAPGEFILSPMVQTPEGPKNLFAALAEQHAGVPAKAEAFKKLAATGLTYKKNDSGELIPQIPDELKTWLPKLVRSSAAEVAAARVAGDAFSLKLTWEQQLTFPPDSLRTCPEGLKPLLEFPQEAYDELKRISRFQPQPDSDAKVTAGKSKYSLFIQQSPNEQAVGFYFFEGDTAKWGPLKLYNVSGNEWVIPTGGRDSVTQAPLCRRVLLQQALPRIRDGKKPDGTGATGREPK